jgi:uncharacterized protein (DUF4415 family)/HEPN domain-containing protein
MKTVDRKEAEMRKEYDFSKGQRGRYAGSIKPGDTDPRNCKVSVTIQLDADLVHYFKRRSSKSNTSFEDQINEFLRDHIAPATEQLNEARRYLAGAKQFQERKFHWAAWDDSLRSISAALKAVINQDREKDKAGIYDEPSIANQINLARSLELLPAELCKSAELILERVPNSQFEVNSVEDSRDAVAAAEKIIKAVECRIGNNATADL